MDKVDKFCLVLFFISMTGGIFGLVTYLADPTIMSQMTFTYFLISFFGSLFMIFAILYVDRRAQRRKE